MNPIGDQNGMMSTEVSSIGVYFTELLKPNDPRTDMKLIKKEKRLEIAGLKEKKVWKVIFKSKVPEDANMLRETFVFAMKGVGTGRKGQGLIHYTGSQRKG